MRTTARIALLLSLLLPLPARAFDYLEHAYLTDRACLETQRRLAPLLTQRPEFAPRYLALSLVCPERWERPYCLDGYKQLEAGLNRLDEPPSDSGDYAASLGDFAALPDHLSDFGPVQGLPQAEASGLTATALGWLTRTGDAGGVVGDVAEDGCESDEEVDWAAVEADVAQAIAAAEAPGGMPAIPPRLLSPTVRAVLPLGPHDPAGPYSFDNPHYLDLVRRNANHFGARAFGTWLGFQSAGRELAARSCEEVLAIDDDALEDLADDLPQFEEIDWDDLEPAELRRQGCLLLAERVRRRLVEWSQRADPRLTEPARAWLDSLDRDSRERRRLLDAVASSLVSLVFEGAGLHFLQDNQAAGHLRVEPQPHDLGASRFFHDSDGRSGLAASFGAPSGELSFVAFGDGTLLGPALAKPGSCDRLEGLSREEVSACLLRRQRGLFVLSSAAALLDWAHGGLLAEDGALAAGGCAEAAGPDQLVCRFLPTRGTSAGALGSPAPRALSEGTLPPPAPPFSYESLLVSTAIDASGGASQFGVRLVFLSQLGAQASWMTSYHLGLMSSAATRTEQSDLQLDFSYTFHWRWAARFLVNAGPFVYGGLRGFGDELSTFAGTGPSVGISLLPEGWTRIPLEIGLTYRVPVTLLDSRYGLDRRAIQVEAHWVELAIGLAFQ